MSRYSVLTILVLLLSILMSPNLAVAQNFYENAKSSTVLIASYDYKGDVIGRGSGFYVDEGIIITNKHVIDGAARYFRIFTTGDDDKMNPDCYQEINLNDVKINTDDDVAYIRAFIDCPHGSVYFSDSDPEIGANIEILGYPAPDSFFESFDLVHTTGRVLESQQGGVREGQRAGYWLRTDAVIHSGNSGGPVIKDGKVVGVATAAHVDEQGNHIDGLFVPVSMIMKGLEETNSSFGYIPQIIQGNSIYEEPKKPLSMRYGTGTPFDPYRVSPNASHGDCRNSLGDGAEATGYGGCECKPSYHKNKEATMCLPGPEGKEEFYSVLSQKTPKKSDSKTEIEFEDLVSDFYAYDEIMSLKKDNVISGYPDGTFKPEAFLNRAELLKILIEGFHSNQIRNESNCFPDVKSEWFAQYVCAAKRMGWIKGYPDGSFKPANNVNRAEAMKIIIGSLLDDYESDSVLPVDVEKDQWFTKYIAKALDLEIIHSYGMFWPGQDLTRADAAVWIYNGSNN